MTAVPAAPRKPASRSALWTFFRLLGGWLTVAALAYLMGVPSKEWGWPTLLFGWVLLTILADEFAGWFGYMALALGVLPLLVSTPPEQWLVIFPLIGGALFALLIMKHSGGPLVLPFGALIFAGVVIGSARFGHELDPSLTFPKNATFQRMALLPMLGAVAFSFLRQLGGQLYRWQQRRNLERTARAALKPKAAAAAAPSKIPNEMVESPVAVPQPEVMAETVAPAADTATPNSSTPEVIVASAVPTVEFSVEDPIANPVEPPKA